MILQNISRIVLGRVLIKISPSNISPTMLLLERDQKILKLFLATVSIDGVIVDRPFGNHKRVFDLGFQVAKVFHLPCSIVSL